VRLVRLVPRDPLRDAQSFFAPRAESYRASASHGNRAELDRMLALIGDVRGKRALDVATGGARTARALADAGADVVAHDATLQMLSTLPWPAVASDAQALPFRDATFDVVATRIAPHHFPDLPRFCREAARILRPGGALYAFDLASPEDARAAAVVDRIERLRDPSHVRSYSAGEWRRALDAAGLAVERLEPTASAFDLEPWVARAAMTPERESELRRLLTEHPAERLDGYGIVAPGRMRVLRVELLARRPA
jgi:SAM-dependent methyltransferase